MYRIKKRAYHLGCVWTGCVLLSCAIFLAKLNLKIFVSRLRVWCAHLRNPDEPISLLKVLARIFSPFAVVTSELWRSERKPAVCRSSFAWSCVHLVCGEQGKHQETCSLLGNILSWLMGPVCKMLAVSERRSFTSVASIKGRKLLNSWDPLHWLKSDSWVGFCGKGILF